LAKGCFGINATCEHGAADPEVSKIIAAAAARLHALLSHAIEAGQRQGEIAPTLSPEAAVAYLQTVMAGLKVMARGGGDPQTLRATIALSLKTLAAL
jgi:hypothetical protein